VCWTGMPPAASFPVSTPWGSFVETKRAGRAQPTHILPAEAIPQGGLRVMLRHAQQAAEGEAEGECTEDGGQGIFAHVLLGLDQGVFSADGGGVVEVFGANCGGLVEFFGSLGGVLGGLRGVVGQIFGGLGQLVKGRWVVHDVEWVGLGCGRPQATQRSLPMPWGECLPLAGNGRIVSGSMAAQAFKKVRRPRAVKDRKGGELVAGFQPPESRVGNWQPRSKECCMKAHPED
jgi:hypothetical protein